VLCSVEISPKRHGSGVKVHPSSLSGRRWRAPVCRSGSEGDLFLRRRVLQLQLLPTAHTTWRTWLGVCMPRTRGSCYRPCDSDNTLRDRRRSTASAAGGSATIRCQLDAGRSLTRNSEETRRNRRLRYSPTVRQFTNFIDVHWCKGNWIISPSVCRWKLLPSSLSSKPVYLWRRFDPKVVLDQRSSTPLQSESSFSSSPSASLSSSLSRCLQLMTSCGLEARDRSAVSDSLTPDLD